MLAKFTVRRYFQTKALGFCFALSITLSLSGCQWPVKSSDQTATPTNQYPLTTYISINTDEQPSILTADYWPTMINELDQSAAVADYLNQNQEKFNHTYHYFYTTRLDHSQEFAIALEPLTLIGSDSTDSILTAPTGLLITNQPPYIILSSVSFSQTIIPHPAKTFLTIHSLNHLQLPRRQPANLASALILNYLTNLSLPVNITDDNFSSSTPASITATDTLTVVSREPLDPTITEPLQAILKPFYVQLTNLNLTNIKKISLTSYKNEFSISFDYPDESVAQDVLDFLKQDLLEQNIYLPTTKTLPDNTDSLVLVPSDKKLPITTTADSIKIELENEFLSIQQSQTQLQITNSDIGAGPENQINLPADYLKEIFSNTNPKLLPFQSIVLNPDFVTINI